MKAVFRKTPLFASLTEKEMQALTLRTISRQLQRGELLFDEGDPLCAQIVTLVTALLRVAHHNLDSRGGVNGN